MKFLKLLFLTILVYPQIVLCQTKPKNQTPYNVLFIAVDDLRTELNCYGATNIQSPNIDRLAKNGVQFTNAHVQQAICMATRASIMSGIRPEKKGIYTGESVTDVLPNVVTMNKFFEKNGYTIASTGKIYHYGDDTKNQFGKNYLNSKSSWVGKGYVSQENTKIFNATKAGPAYESANVHDTIYPDGINTLNAMRRLETLKKENKPFFMAVGLTKPHLPFIAPKKYWDMYPESSIKLSELPERPKNSSKYTVRFGGELSAYTGMPKLFKDIPDSTAIKLRHGYFASVSYIDAQIGNLLNKLEELGLRENTIVVLWGDHGYKLGDYGSWCKWSNMNIDTNIPFIFNVPGGAKGEVYKHPVEALDMYPTLAELCGLKPPAHLEGKSLVSILKNPKKEPKDKMYAYSIWPDERWNFDKTVMGYSVKDDRFNYVEWVQLTTGKVVERELYDHEKDPKETENVVNDTQYQNVISELAQKVKEKKNSTDLNHNFKNLKQSNNQ